MCTGYLKMQLLIKDHSFCVLFSYYERKEKVKHFLSALGVRDGQKTLSGTDTLILGSISWSRTLREEGKATS